MTVVVETHPSASLRLYTFGLSSLLDPNWSGITLYDHLKRHVRGRAEPTNLLFKTLERGLLFHLGKWLFDELFVSSSPSEICEGENAVWLLEDWLELIKKAELDFRPATRRMASSFELLEALYEESELKYFEEIDRRSRYLDLLHASAIRRLKSGLSHVSDSYASEFADRVFHDRQLCEFISQLLVAIRTATVMSTMRVFPKLGSIGGVFRNGLERPFLLATAGSVPTVPGTSPWS